MARAYTKAMQVNSLQLQGYNQDGCPNHITIQYLYYKNKLLWYAITEFIKPYTPTLTRINIIM